MMKKMILMAAVAVLAVPAMASAQSTVTATATVGNYSLVSGTGNLVFGTVDRTTGRTIDAAGGTDYASRAVSFNHNIAVTFTSVPTALTSPAGNSLPVSLTCASRMGATWSAVTACSTASLNLDVGTALTQAELGFGGTITGAAVSNAVAGSYEGIFNIVVTAR